MKRYGKKMASRIKEAKQNPEATLDWADLERGSISNLVHKDRANRYIILPTTTYITGKKICACNSR